MIISAQGFGHYGNNVNNQDFGVENENLILICDGCSGCVHSEVGTRIFGQLFAGKEECSSLDKFEQNAKDVFERMVSMFESDVHNIEDFILDNFLFTIWAVFEDDEKFVVKYFGDGYIITKNKYNSISYIKLSYGKKPPYLAYKYCDQLKETYKDYDFKTVIFPKSEFKAVGIGTDGIAPFAKRDVIDCDKLWFDGTKQGAIMATLTFNRSKFYDDVTIGYYIKKEGKTNE